MPSLTLGSIFTNGLSVIGVFVILMLCVCGCSAFLLGISAGLDIADYATKGQRYARTKPAAPVYKFIGAACLFEVPQVLGITWGGFLGITSPMQSLAASASGVAMPTNCLASGNSNPVECIITNISVDVIPQFVTFLLVMAGATALYFIAKFIHAMIDRGSYHDAASKPLPWGKLVVGVVFAGIGFVLEVFGSSIGLSGGLVDAAGFQSTANAVSYLPMVGSLTPQVQEMIQGAIIILGAVGVYEVIHGGFILAGAMDGNQQSSGWKATVHVVLGMALVYFPAFVAAVIFSGLGTVNY